MMLKSNASSTSSSGSSGTSASAIPSGAPVSPIPLGRYRHYKGKYYSVLGFARHSETEEWMVLYVPLYGDGGYWVRPLAMFTEEVQVNGGSQPRFSYCSPGHD